MGSKLKLEGPKVVYVISAIVNNNMTWIPGTSNAYVLATVENDGRVSISKRLPEDALKQLIQSGKQIQNMTIKQDKLALKGDKDITSLSAHGNSRICLAEITTSNGNKVSYLIINRRGETSTVSRDAMIALVKYKLVDNYYITSDNQLRRNPNQEVAKLVSSKSLVFDTYSSMSNNELTELLLDNGFTLGYKSEKFTTKNPWGEIDEWVAYAWYDKNGAVIWYNCYLSNKKEEPFYAGGHLYIGAEVVMDASEQIKRNIRLGEYYSNKPGHQRLYIDARQSLIAKYKSMLQAIKPLNPWDFDDRGQGLMAHSFSRRDYEQRLKDIAYSIKGAPSEKEDNMFMYSLYSDIATYYTIQNFDGELRSIFSSYERNFLSMLGETIGNNLNGNVLLKMEDKDIIEEYLKQVKIKLPHPLSKYIEDAKEKQRERKRAQEERLKSMHSGKSEYLIGDLVKWNKG